MRKLLLILIGSVGVLMTSSGFAQSTSIIAKPLPRGSIGEEAGRSVANVGGDILMGAYILKDQRHGDSGGAFLFESGATTPSITYELPPTVIINKFSASGLGPRCEISNTNGALLGDRVAMSGKWVALATNSLGRQVSNDDYSGTCDEVVPTVFLSKRVSNGRLNHNVSLPTDEVITGLAVSDEDLIIMTDETTYIYSFNGYVWLHNYSYPLGVSPGNSFAFHAPVAIDGSFAVAGYPKSPNHLIVFKKTNRDWQAVDFLQSVDTSYAKAVALEGNAFVVGSDAKLEFWKILTDSSGVTDIERVNDFSVSHSVRAVSLSEDIASAFFNPDVPINIYRKNFNHWALHSDHVAQADVLDLPIPSSPSNTVGDFNTSGWYVDQLDIYGGIIAAGWRGYHNTASGGEERINGAVVLHDVNRPFSNFPLLDGAENPDVKWASNGDFIWSRNSGPTPSRLRGTGPTGGANGSSHYYFVETSSGYAHNSGDIATLESNYFSPEGVILTFDSHRYGSDQGLLQLEYKVFGESQWRSAEWASSGNQGDQWQSNVFYLFILNIPQGSDRVKVRFKYTAAGGYRGDIAIDNILLTRD